MLIDVLKEIAKRKEATLAQISLAWLLAKKPWIVPIPGTTKSHRLEENIGALEIYLTDQEMTEIEAAASQILIIGARYPAHMLEMTGR